MCSLAGCIKISDGRDRGVGRDFFCRITRFYGSGKLFSGILT